VSRKAKPDREGFVGGEHALFFQQIADAKRVGLEAVARFLPVSGRVDVGAVCEMGAVEFQKTILLDHESRRLAEEVDGVLVDDPFDRCGVMMTSSSDSAVSDTGHQLTIRLPR